MDEPFEYLQRRVEPQRKWHSEKAGWNKRLFYGVEMATLLAGATIPVVLLWAADDAYWGRVLPALLGGVVVVATSIGKLFKFQENWLQYRTLVESLEREEELYKAHTATYSEVNEGVRNRLFVERIENLLASTTSQFIATHQAAMDSGASRADAQRKL